MMLEFCAKLILMPLKIRSRLRQSLELDFKDKEFESTKYGLEGTDYQINQITK